MMNTIFVKISILLFFLAAVCGITVAVAAGKKQITEADKNMTTAAEDPVFLRTSVRSFTPQKVEQEKLDKLLRAAMAAPSAGNEQPWEFYITENHDVMEKLSRADRYASPAANAPLLLILCYDKNKLLYPDFPLIDMACCAENIMIEAAGLGLGTVFLSIAPIPDRMKTVSTVLNLPDNIVPYVLIPVGYPSAAQQQEDRYDANRIHVIK